MTQSALVAAAAVALATLARYALYTYYGERLPFLVFFPAIVIAALVAGVRGGLIALAISAAIAALFMGPASQYQMRSVDRYVGMMLFLFVGSLIVAVCVSSRNALATARRAMLAQHESETVSRQAEDRLSLALVSSRLGDWKWDAQTDFVDMSPRAAEIFGIPAGATMTWTAMRQLLHEEDRELARCAVERAIADRSDYDVEYRVNRPDGQQVWVAAMGRGQYGRNQAVLGMLGVVQDVSARVRATVERDRLLAQAREAHAEAERASRLKDEFLATVSHELRTPLNAILGYSSLLRRNSEPNWQRVKDGLEVIERNARSQAQIIEDILDMSRIVSGKLRLDVQSSNMATVIDAALDTVRPAADAKDIIISRIIDPVGAIVSGDPARLQQVIWNLLANAIKFTPKHGRVTISLARVASQVDVTITDTGQGIEPEFLPHVFDKFRQADASTARRHGGLGLGLTIVKNIVELHGGMVGVHSKGAGEGSTFTVSIPVAAVYHTNVAAQQATPAAPGDRPSLDSVNVLVVDDEPDARALVRSLLQECGANVTTASSADEALNLLQQRPVDVLVSDIGMPGMDGYELLRAIRARTAERYSQIPAAAFTAFARSEDRTRALMAGYQTHIAKPVDPSELVFAVASLAGKTGRG